MRTVRVWLALGLTVMVWIAPVHHAQAHEIQASVADLSFENGAAVLKLRTNLEARIAGIGAAHDDTDAAPEAETYDRLRSLEPGALRDALDSDAFAGRFLIEADGTRLPFALEGVSVPEVGDTEIARETAVVLRAPLPAGTKTVTIAMHSDYGDLILRGTGDNESYSEFLQTGIVSQPIAVTGGTLRTFGAVFVQYLGVGFEHIIPLGLDHILFVVGLFLLSSRLTPLLWQVSAFTLAHTVTLALGALDVVRVPPSVVEPLIALSIVFVCVENLFSEGHSRWRLPLVFGFGLLHGLGFAFVFEDYGIPEGQFVAALLAFNVGVEFGQLAVIGLCLLLVGWFRNRMWYRSAVIVPGSLIVGAVGLYWFLERVL